jgi:predicted signal transduction protein with EAL and GGDEF domain
LLRTVREDSGVMVRHGRPLTVSIGMTSFGEDPKAGGPGLMVLADVAMYEAKARGGDDCVVYDPNVAVSGQARIARQSWSTRIRDALDRDTFELYSQPIIDLQTSKVVQRETLLRMRDGEDLILPGAFLYTAERFGLARELGSCSLRLPRERARVRPWRLSSAIAPLACTVRSIFASTPDLRLDPGRRSRAGASLDGGLVLGVGLGRDVRQDPKTGHLLIVHTLSAQQHRVRLHDALNDHS